MNYDEEDLRSRLSEAPTPEHTDGFRDRVSAMLDQEAASSTKPSKGKITPFARRGRVVAAGGAVAAAGVVVALISTSNPFGSLSEVAGTSPTSIVTEAPTKLRFTLASEVIEEARLTYDQIRTIQATVTTTDSGGAVTFAQSFKANDEGSYTYSDANGQVSSYDAKALTSLNYGSYTTNYNGSTGAYGGFSIYSLLRGMEVADNPSLETLNVDGETRYRIRVTTPSPIIGIGQIAPIGLTEITATFDADTLLVRTIDAGGFHTEVTDLKVNQDFPEGTFDVKVPAGASIGYDAKDLPDPSSTLLPTAPEGWTPGVATANGQYGRSVQSFHQGLRSFQVTLSATDEVMNNPYYTVDTANQVYSDVTITGGSFAGSAQIVTNFAQGAYLEARKGNLTVYLGGELSNEEMIDIANHLVLSAEG